MASTNSSAMIPGAPVLPPGLAPPQIPSLDNTYGVLMIGTFLVSYCMGLLCTKGIATSVYRRTVAVVLYVFDSVEDVNTDIHPSLYIMFDSIMETWHSVISMHSVYYYLTTNYFKPAVLFRGVWSVDLIPMSTGRPVINTLFSACQGLIISVSQSRPQVQTFCGHHRPPPLRHIRVLNCFVQPDLTKFESSTSWMVNTALGMVILADGMSTVLLIHVLRRSRTGFQSTDTVLNVLIQYAINTGLLTGYGSRRVNGLCHGLFTAFCPSSTLSTASFFMGVFKPHTLLANGMNMWVAKLYANSLLAVLNSRDFLKGYAARGATTGASSGRHLSAGMQSSGGGRSTTAMKSGISHNVIDIKISKNIDVVDDALHSRDNLPASEGCDSCFATFCLALFL
ncbi:hypothetical protein C8Q77DRAFT_1072039 [Trametes polyzona]|nr:hypothetical protein C8Q77DRAFT_1072039 [Trametes polyzona]